jgi:hypothetical protein
VTEWSFAGRRFWCGKFSASLQPKNILNAKKSPIVNNCWLTPFLKARPSTTIRHSNIDIAIHSNIFRTLQANHVVFDNIAIFYLENP